jgi:type VI secretion system secreted protein VgrG
MVAAVDETHTTDLAFEIDGVTQLFHVVRLDGFEALSELFQLQVTLATQETSSTIRGVVGQEAVLTLSGGRELRKVQGIVSRFRQGASTKRHVVYHATLVPKLFPLTHRIDARIFQEKSTPEIIEAVLGEAGLASGDYRLALEQTYEPRTYCVQYRESDWAFVARLAEEEGIFFFFEDADGQTRVVFGDSTHGNPAIDGGPNVLFRPPGGGVHSVEAVTQIEHVEELHSGKVTLRDYNFEKPGLSLESTFAGSRHDALETFDYPGGFQVPAGGDRLARLRTEEREATGRTLDGETSSTRFAPGHTFTLEDHPLADLNADYLVTALQHDARQPLGAEIATTAEHGYAARFTAQPRDVPYRPRRLTAKPTIHVQTAIVVGPDGTEIHTDEHGRIKVQFHWDRRGEKNEKSSCWIRVSQPWAGAGFGGIFLPRVGQEVVVDFLDGDPDRPIVVGRVYHGTNVPPYGLPDHKTRSTLKSMSSPDGEAGNELRFEDEKDSEEVYLHAQKDLTIAVENDRKATVGNDDGLEVTGKREVTVGGTESLTVDGDTTVDLAKKYTLSVGDKLTIEVTGDAAETVEGKKTIEVQGEKLEITCGQSKVKISQSSVEIESTEVKVKGTGSTTIESDGKVEVKASGQTTVKADGSVKVEASGMVTVKGAQVKVN